MTKEIKITIDPLGNPVIDAVGFNGQGCAEATQAIEEALAGSTEVDKVYKPEWQNVADEEEDTIHQTRW